MDGSWGIAGMDIGAERGPEVGVGPGESISSWVLMIFSNNDKMAR